MSGTTTRRRVLIITYYWPPAGGSGVQRHLKFAKYLREFGWEPVIYTCENADYPAYDPELLKEVPQGLEVIRRPIWEPFHLWKKLIGQRTDKPMSASLTQFDKKPDWKARLGLWVRGNLFIPDAKMFWIRPSVAYLSQYLRQNPVEAIISTSPPQSTHLIARALHRKLGIPWLADFRDPWTQIDYIGDINMSRLVYRIHQRLERSVLREANAVTVVGPTMADMMRSLYPRPYQVITNGYDEADLSPEPIAPSDKFSLLHIGVLVPRRNNPELWQVLGELVDERADFRRDLEVRLIGLIDEQIKAGIRAAGLGDNVVFGDYIPHSQAIIEQQKAQVLMLFVDNNPHAAHILTGKFFEYMMVARPILCIGPPEGDAARILQEIDAGLVAPHGDAAALKAHVLEFYTRYQQGRNTVNPQGTERFSRRNLTGELALSLQRITTNE